MPWLQSLRARRRTTEKKMKNHVSATRLSCLTTFRSFMGSESKSPMLTDISMLLWNDWMISRKWWGQTKHFKIFHISSLFKVTNALLRSMKPWNRTCCSYEFSWICRVVKSYPSILLKKVMLHIDDKQSCHITMVFWLHFSSPLELSQRSRNPGRFSATIWKNFSENTGHSGILLHVQLADRCFYFF